MDHLNPEDLENLFKKMRIIHAAPLVRRTGDEIFVCTECKYLIKFTSFKSYLSDGDAKKISIFLDVPGLVELPTFARQQKF